MIKQFDVFLAHNSQDKSQVQEIANKLKEKGLVPWLDKEQILGGDSIPQKVTLGLGQSKAAIFFIGLQGLGKFQEVWELDTLIMLCSQQGIPIIPVLLPGVNQLPSCLLMFAGKKWIQFKSSINELTSLDLLIRSISTHVNRPIESTEEIQRQPDTNELLQNLANPDPLVCFAAARILRGRSDLGEKIINISAHSHVVEEAVRMVLESFPEKSAELLVATIRDCSTTGESWGRASRASRYCSPSHSSFTEGLLVDFLKQGSSNIERLRHVLMALGRIGCLAFYTTEINDLFINNIGRRFIYKDDLIQKCFSFALKGAAWNFVLASDLSIGTASRSFLNLMDLGEKTRRPLESVPLGLCSLRHVDEILTTWLDADSPYVKRLGLMVLGRLRVARSAKKILRIFQQHRDDDIAEAAVHALWCIGEPNSIKALLNLGTSVLAGQGLLLLHDEDSFDRWLPRILESNYAWLAYRAIGLRTRKDKISLLQDGLFHTNPVHRGSAALALARLGEHNGLKKAYEESDNVDERIFTALAVLSAELVDYSSLEKQLRIDLAKQSFIYDIEAQEDILTILRECGVQKAEELAQAWTPFYGKGNVEIGLSFS
jgi:TIR domain